MLEEFNKLNRKPQTTAELQAMEQSAGRNNPQICRELSQSTHGVR